MYEEDHSTGEDRSSRSKKNQEAIIWETKASYGKQSQWEKERKFSPTTFEKRETDERETITRWLKEMETSCYNVIFVYKNSQS